MEEKEVTVENMAMEGEKDSEEVHLEAAEVWEESLEEEMVVVMAVVSVVDSD